MPEWIQRPIDAPAGDLFSIEQVATMLSVSPDTVERWIADGDFPAGLRQSKRSVVWDWQSIAFYRLRLAMSPRLVAKVSTAQRGQETA